MKLKRMLACGLAIASLFCMTAAASAAAPKTAVQTQQDAKVAEAKKVAYMDVETPRRKCEPVFWKQERR